METIAIEAYKNEEFAIESRIFQSATGGFNVVLFDHDVGETLPTVKNFKGGIEDARIYAKALVA